MRTDCAEALADLSLRLVVLSEGAFSHVVAEVRAMTSGSSVTA